MPTGRNAFAMLSDHYKMAEGTTCHVYDKKKPVAHAGSTAGNKPNTPCSPAARRLGCGRLPVQGAVVRRRPLELL